jgi:hypothetical protein
MQPAIAESWAIYETLLHQYLDGRPIPPSTQRSSAVERDRAFFGHPLWEAAPHEVFEHELFAVAYRRYFGTRRGLLAPDDGADLVEQARRVAWRSHRGQDPGTGGDGGR